MKKVFLCGALAFSVFCLRAQSPSGNWADSVFQTLSVDQKIGQLFMPRLDELSETDAERLADYVAEHHIGGILITQGQPVSHVRLIKKLQSKSHLPLLVGIEPAPLSEGLLDSLVSFPPPLALGSIRNDSLLYKLGKEVARQLQVLGIHVYFGPNADMDWKDEVYPASLNYFGDSRQRVATRSRLFVDGLQHHGVMAVITHPFKNQTFTASTSQSANLLELTLPDTTVFYPYQHLINAGVGGILTANLHYHTPSGKQPLPANIAQLYISEIIKKKLGYQGLLFTEVPLLQNWVDKPRPGETEALAIQVGNDVLIDPLNLSATVRTLKRRLRSDRNFADQLEEVVKKIITVKYQLGLFNSNQPEEDNLLLKLNSPDAQLLKRTLTHQSISVVNNKDKLLPFRHLSDKKFALIAIGQEVHPALENMLNKYAPFDVFAMRVPADSAQLHEALANYDHAVAVVYPQASSFLTEVLPYLYSYRSAAGLTLCHIGDARQLVLFQDYATLVHAHTPDALTHQLLPQILFGGIAANGELPLSVSEQLPEGKGEFVNALERFAYTLPEEAGVDSNTLRAIESIAREAIDSGATPGCHVLIARNGKVIYDRSFGWQTYDNQIAVNDQTLYDLASITKVSATLQAIMFLYEHNMIDLNKKASVYLPELKNSNKKDFTLIDILTHQAGLWPFLPFWADTMKDSVHMPEYYSYGPSEAYPFPVSENLFASAAMKDSLWNWIVRAKVRPKVNRTPFDYRYSDMGFYILQHLAEKLLNQPIEDFLAQNLYEPLGAFSVGYLPLNRFAPERIAPTENDRLFRKSLLRGYVHDQGAAMHGGVAGHAGLFSNANDLAKLGQLWLNKGSYGGERIYKPETVELFTRKQFDTSRRGLGWDKPTPSDWNGPTTLFASNQTFGHTGFTGTCIWVDPAFDLVYVFLSNRVHPNMNNNKLLTANIRPRIQEVIYKAIFNYCQYR